MPGLIRSDRADGITAGNGTRQSLVYHIFLKPVVAIKVSNNRSIELFRWVPGDAQRGMAVAPVQQLLIEQFTSFTAMFQCRWFKRPALTSSPNLCSANYRIAKNK